MKDKVLIDAIDAHRDNLIEFAQRQAELLKDLYGRLEDVERQVAKTAPPRLSVGGDFQGEIGG